MHHCCLLIISLILAVGLGACNSTGAPTPTESIENTVRLKPVPAVLVQERDRVVDVVKSKIGSTESRPPSELRRAQFIDATTGWAGSSQFLYRTSDGGINWKRLDSKVPEDSWISSFFFIDPNHGWLTVIHKNTTSSYGSGGGSSILATNDGGDSWSEQLSFSNNSWLRDVSFWDASNGIAIGGRIVRIKGEAGALTFALGTKDGGKTWKDISEDLARAIKTPYVSGNDEGKSIHWSSSSRILILTTRGRLVATEDGGKTWTTLVHFDEEYRPYVQKTALYTVLFDPKGRSVILGGIMGDEGYRANLIAPDESNTWQSYELIRVPLLDAVFLSESEILAVGEEHKLRDEQASGSRLPEGIVLHSKDNGKSWSPIYRTGSPEILISLTKINETDFYAVSDIGNFIKFRLK